MTKIVIGFDGREEARDALHLAKALARVMDAMLHIAVVISYEPLPIEVEAYEKAREEHFERLLVQAARQLDGMEFVAHKLGDASVPQALDGLADEVGAGLIVLGSTHRGKLGRIHPGSVAERLLNGAPCAVAVAPRGYARGNQFGLGVVGVAYDGSPESELALEMAKGIARRTDGSLRLIAAVPHLPPGPARGSDMPVLREQFEEVLGKGANSIEGIDVERKLVDGPAASVLADQAVELDLLVIGSRGYGPLRRTLLGGVSDEVMRTAPCPVIVVPRGTESTSRRASTAKKRPEQLSKRMIVS